MWPPVLHPSGVGDFYPSEATAWCWSRLEGNWQGDPFVSCVLGERRGFRLSQVPLQSSLSVYPSHSFHRIFREDENSTCPNSAGVPPGAARELPLCWVLGADAQDLVTLWSQRPESVGGPESVEGPQHTDKLQCRACA